MVAALGTRDLAEFFSQGRINGHYNAVGYRAVAEIALEHLTTESFISRE